MLISIHRCARRDFFQRLDEKHLANQLKDIAATVHGDAVSRVSPVVRTYQEMNATPSASSRDFSLDEKDPHTGPWSNFESFNKARKPLWQDATHADTVTIQRQYMEKRMADNKLRWLKQQRGSTPTEGAWHHMQELKRTREEEEAIQPGRTPIDPEQNKFDAIMDETARLVFQSRARTKIRNERVENTKIVKAPTPSIGGVTTDPIKQHVWRRNIRLNAMLCSHIEQLLTMNTSQILHEMLEGASLTIVGIKADGPRAAHKVYFQVASLPPGRDKAWVESRMETLAPKLRAQIAAKLQLGYTPELRFHLIHHALKSQSRQRLFRIAKKIQNQKAQGLLSNWVSEMNWGNRG
eukprot:GEMP01057342.1.p1 GENE.GEMP01057342.1~~GEMP01057342.1.p1  ORF type:complete len:370 (+),score=59.18 GEMP01057342.1:59-1111(+)